MEEKQKMETATETKKKKKKTPTITVKANKKGKHVLKVLNFLRVIVIPVYFLFKPFRFYGNKTKKEGACIYVCNHYTLFDAVFPAAMTWEVVHFVGKKEIFDTFGLGLLARKVKMISVNRDGSDVRGLLDCLKCLKNGEKIAIFPEGTRNKTEAEFLPFHHGAAMMSIRAKAPIIPMVIYKKPRLFRRTHVLLGEPLEFSEYYGKKMTEEEYMEADNKLLQAMINLRAEHRQYLENKKQKKA